MNLTPKAVSKIIEVMQKEQKNFLRVEVAAGGCSGFQYKMRLEEYPATMDKVINKYGIALTIDRKSFPILENVTLDFLDGLEGTGFKFTNPDSKRVCGCGKSFC